MTEPDRGHSVGTTRPITLAIAVVVGLAIGGVFPLISERGNRVAPNVPWSAIGALAFLAAVLGGFAWTTWRTLHRRRLPMDARRAVNLLVLGKASALVGALLAGAYIGFGVHYIGSMNVDLPRSRVIHSLLAMLASIGVGVGGLLLERACRVPRDPDDKRTGASSSA
ncbi:MAG: DUF3180 domain-containing protein [Nocardioidaceae bacterium]